MGEFKSFTLPHDFKFSSENVPPPPGLYVSTDDVLFVEVDNTKATLILRVTARLLDKTNHVQVYDVTINPGSSGTQVRAVQPLNEGIILSVCAFPTVVSPVRGECYVTVGIQRSRVITPDALRIQTFFSGYLTQLKPLSWPGGPMIDPEEGPGLVHRVAVGNPAAGAEWFTTVPVGAEWRLIGGLFQLVTSATVATRVVALSVQDNSGLECARYFANSSQAASLTEIYSLVGNASNLVAAANRSSIPFPDALRLPAGFHLTTFTDNLQGGDQYSAIALIVDEVRSNV